MNSDFIKDKKAIHKFDKIDSLLLFLSSSISLGFSFIQSFVGGSESLIYFIPLIILSGVLPIYTGYIKGSIIYDSVTERIRGWMYLFNGSIFYLFSISIYLIFYYLAPKDNNTNNLIFYFSVSFVSVVGGFILAIYNNKLEESICKLSKVKESIEMSKAVQFTLLASMWGGLGSVVMISVLRVITDINLQIISIGIFFIITIFSPFILFENQAQSWSKKAREKPTPKKKKLKRINDKMAMVGFFILLMVIINLRNIIDLYLIERTHISQLLLIIMVAGLITGVIFIFLGYPQKKKV